jgi:hypothetical protein
MTLQTRKLNLIQDLIGITDAGVLARMEGCLKEERTKAYEKSLKPMSQEEFVGMIECSREDVRAGRVVGLEELRNRVARW